MNPQQLVSSFRESADCIRKRLPDLPIDATIVLGSGLKEFSNTLENSIHIPYQDIPHFPSDQVPGHGSEIVFGTIGNKNILIFTGRFHYYQGFSITMTGLPAWISFYLGVPRYILTNASGGVNASLKVGELLVIQDHLNPTGLNPLRGIMLKQWKDPFFDTSNMYDEGLRKSLLKTKTARELSIKQGTYCFLTGPNFETPAEIEMLRTWGTDIVGMSSVPESLVAHKLELKVLGLSVVTNVYPEKNAKGLEVNHAEVLQETKKTGLQFGQLMKEWISIW